MPSLIDRVSTRSTISKEHKCTVQLLDDTQTMTVDFKKHELGQAILDYICEMLNIVEKDYFGLRYVDSNRHRYWLDCTKPILRQVKGSSVVFAFRVKFYPSDPTIVKEELTRYLLALQLKRDLLHGRLYCPQSDAAVLGAYIIQGEIGDYNPTEHANPSYVSQFKLFLNQTPKLEEKIALEHQKLKGKGLTPADADFQFLKKACTLDTYGYYPYTIKEPKAGQVYMGATPHGVLVYQTHRKLHHIKWDDINSFDYDGKDFYIYPTPEYFDENNLEKNGAKKKPSLKFNCPSATFCKHLWKYMMAQQAFFTKPKANDVKPVAIRRGPLFRRATFRYTGRVLQEIKEAPSPKRAEPSFERSHLQRQMPRDERNAPWANKFHTLPRATKPVPEISEYQSAQIVNKDVPDRGINRDSLMLDTTAQTSPIITPVLGLSPASNGLSLQDTSATTASADDSFVVNRFTTTTTTTTSVGGNAYKQDTVTVSLKRVEQLEEDITKAVKNFEREAQLPLGTSTPIVDRDKLKEVAGNVKEEVVKKEEIVKKTVVSSLAEQPLLSQQTKITTTKLSTPTVEKTKVETEVKAARVSPVVQAPARREGGGVARALIKTVLSGVMFTILLVGTVIVIMEIQDPQFRQYLRHIPGEDTFRHQYYEPSRQRALEWYEGVSGRPEELSE